MNPTKKVAKLASDGSPTKNGRRVPLATRAELVDWLKRKSGQGGFSIDENTLRSFSRGREYFDKNGQRGLHTAPWSSRARLQCKTRRSSMNPSRAVSARPRRLALACWSSLPVS